MNILTKIGIITGGLLLIGVAAAIVFTFAQNRPSGPQFSYNSWGRDGWYESYNGNLQAYATGLGDQYKGKEPIEKLSIADLTVHHGEIGADKTPEDNCFIGFSYFDYALENGLEAAYKEYEEGMIVEGNLESFSSRANSLKTPDGNKEYELRQYDFTVEGVTTLSGYQIGYIDLESAHIKIDGACRSTDDLALTLPILDAVTFKTD